MRSNKIAGNLRVNLTPQNFYDLVNGKTIPTLDIDGVRIEVRLDPFLSRDMMAQVIASIETNAGKPPFIV